MAEPSSNHYYVPPPNAYPVVLNVGLFLLALGFILKITALASGVLPMLAGAALFLYAAFAWIANVVTENETGRYHRWEDRSFRIGMAFFIFGEIAFFSAFLLAMMYLRVYSLPTLGSYDPQFTPWPDFKGDWPSSGPAGKPFTALSPAGLPTINALLLLASVVALVWARKGLAIANRGQMIAGLAIAGVIGVVFLFQQAQEYGHAAELGVTLAGAYGTNFYALTGLHAVHVVVGLVMFTVLLVRGFLGHFTAESHFGLDAVSWYWTFAVVIPGWLVYIYFYWL